MADGWRSRYMAPFYALVISFVLVFLLGLALQEPTGAEERGDDPPTTTVLPRERPEPLGIRFSSTEEFPVVSAIVFWDDTKKVVRDARGLLALRPDTAVTVCGQLQRGWAAVGATSTPDNNVVCWGPSEPAPGEFITLQVREER